jgi:hypothetical protein
MIPALHWAITNSGPDTKKRGDPITGIDKLFLIWFGIATYSSLNFNFEIIFLGSLTLNKPMP